MEKECEIISFFSGMAGKKQKLQGSQQMFNFTFNEDVQHRNFGILSIDIHYKDSEILWEYTHEKTLYVDTCWFSSNSFQTKQESNVSSSRHLWVNCCVHHPETRKLEWRCTTWVNKLTHYFTIRETCIYNACLH